MARDVSYTLLSDKMPSQRSSRSYARLSTRFGVSTTRFTTYCLLILTVLLTTLVVRSASARDPGSWFFNPQLGYAQKYSAVRQRQAESFIAAAEGTRPYPQSTADTVGLCVGIPSIARDGARYLRSTVGSLLAGLSPEERAGIFLMLFIPHTDPTIHPAYHEPWLSNMADEILLYNLSGKELECVNDLERTDVEHRPKGLSDYTYLMKACYRRGAPYIALLEDDVIAMDGWYHRTVDAIRQAEVLSASKRRMRDGFLYLRLFYTEELLGWNSQDWPAYAFWSILFALGCALPVYWTGQCRRMRNISSHLACRLPIVFLIVPWLIILFFAAGRVTVLPLPPGVNEMNNFGCCAQGLVYPRHKALDLIEWYESKRLGFADMLTKHYANEHEELRYAITPSVLQHVGVKSSKSDDFGHFAFELLPPKTLREEHELAALDPVTLGKG